jgi:hypothetical protein
LSPVPAAAFAVAGFPFPGGEFAGVRRSRLLEVGKETEMGTLAISIASQSFACGNELRNVCAAFLLVGGAVLLSFALRLLLRRIPSWMPKPDL